MRANTRYTNSTSSVCLSVCLSHLACVQIQGTQTPPEVHPPARYIHLKVRVTVGDSGLCYCYCTCVTYFEHQLTPLCVDSARALWASFCFRSLFKQPKDGCSRAAITNRGYYWEENKHLYVPTPSHVRLETSSYSNKLDWRLKKHYSQQKRRRERQ